MLIPDLAVLQQEKQIIEEQKQLLLTKQAELLQQQLAQANQKLADLKTSFSDHAHGNAQLTSKLVKQVSYQNQRVFVNNLENNLQKHKRLLHYQGVHWFITVIIKL